MKKIRLIDLLRFIDPITYVVIWTPEDEDDPVYEGACMDVPWYLADGYVLRDPKDNEMDGTIDCRQWKDDKGRDKYGMILVVEEANDSEGKI